MSRHPLLVLSTVIFLFTAAACSDSGGSLEDFCAASKARATKAGQDDFIGTLDRMRDNAPEEIEDDVKVYVDAIGEYHKASDAADSVDEEIAANDVMDSEEVREAGVNVNRFLEENC
jgi:hypothetical protein